MAPPAVAVAGWYGKLPALGDFASRRLPPSFIGVWDPWLQRGLAASRATLGERWLEVYLNGPVWRFALLPGLCGETGWLGTMLPSVDRVGRHFPLTLALEVPTAAHVLAALTGAADWFAALDQAALACLDIRCLPEHLEARLAALAFPVAPEDAGAAASLLAGWWPAGTGTALAAPMTGTAADAIRAAALVRMAEGGHGVSLWWREGAAPMAGRLLAFHGLPAERDFLLLLDDPDDGLHAGPVQRQ